jgi:hypothetical protein
MSSFVATPLQQQPPPPPSPPPNPRAHIAHARLRRVRYKRATATSSSRRSSHLTCVMCEFYLTRADAGRSVCRWPPFPYAIAWQRSLASRVRPSFFHALIAPFNEPIVQNANFLSLRRDLPTTENNLPDSPWLLLKADKPKEEKKKKRNSPRVG